MPLRFDAPILLAVCLGIIALTVGLVLWRRPAVPRTTRWLVLAGMVAMALGAGGVAWRRAARGEVTVMVDLSASTRSAAYRDRASLERRIGQLIGDAPRHVVYFSDANRAAAEGGVLPDLPGERTVFAPPATASRVLLFSDGRFELPVGGPPTFVVVDPGLEAVQDAAVTKLEIRGGTLAAEVRVSGGGGGARELTLTGRDRIADVGNGSFTITSSVGETVTSGTAQFSAGDAWPENDGLSIHSPPPARLERWWVGDAKPDGWRPIEPASLPEAAEEYLRAGIIVLNDVPAQALSPAAMARLQQYVRDLGGSLVVLGGDHAFGAGGYLGTTLEDVSPLTSAPPRPVTDWFVLVDGSGSMNGVAAAGTRWEVATAAVRLLLPRLPPADLVRVGSFAKSVTWWAPPTPARALTPLPLPPEGLSPSGPTNLQAAIDEVARGATGEGPKNLLLVTDADANIDSPERIAADFKQKRVRVSVLAIGNGAALPALRQISSETGGGVLSAADASKWAVALEELGRAGMPEAVERSPVEVRFRRPLALPPRSVAPWNRTWIKDKAESLAEGDQPLVARWRVGTGEVAAMAFAPTAAEIEAMAALVARPPRDPRFTVTWDSVSQLRVTVDAIDRGAYVNGLPMTLELRSSNGAATLTQNVPQVGPGKYAVATDAPRAPVFASLRASGAVIGQMAVAARYAPEFDAIGNDHAAMNELARRTGGKVIDTRQQAAIEFQWPRRDVLLTEWCAAIGAALVAAGLLYWKRAPLTSR